MNLLAKYVVVLSIFALCFAFLNFGVFLKYSNIMIKQTLIVSEIRKEEYDPKINCDLMFPSSISKNNRIYLKESFLKSRTYSASNNTDTVIWESLLLEYLANSKDCQNYNENVSQNCIKTIKSLLPCLTSYQIEIHQKCLKQYSEPQNKIFHALPPLREWSHDQNDQESIFIAKDFVPNWDQKINLSLTINEIKERGVNRIKFSGDDDVQLIPEVVKELRENKMIIPNIVHFIWFECRRFRVDHFITLLSVIKYQKPSVILFHTDCEPDSEYWSVIKNIAKSKLKVVKRTQPASIFGQDINVIEHRADVARLEALLEVGGIYLDTDSVILKSLNKFRLSNKLVLAEETDLNLSNGVILGHKNSWALKRWYYEYKNFIDSEWGRNSLYVPWAISKIWPNKINTIYSAMIRPNFEELTYIFNYNYNFENSYVIHLYSRFMLKWDGYIERPLTHLTLLNSTYGEIARKVIWGDKTTFSLKKWINACDLEK